MSNKKTNNEEVKNVLRSLQGYIIGIAGQISSGKTEAGNKITEIARQNKIPLTFLAEKRHTPLLDLYTSDPVRYGFPFQLVMCENSVNRESFAKLLSVDDRIVLVERPAIENVIFAKTNKIFKNISEEDYKFYNQMLPAKISGNLDVLVYLHASEHITRERRDKRGEAAEKKYPNDYMFELDNQYFESMLGHIQNDRIPICIMLWDEFGSYSDMIKNISDYIHKRRVNSIITIEKIKSSEHMKSMTAMTQKAINQVRDKPTYNVNRLFVRMPIEIKLMKNNTTTATMIPWHLYENYKRMKKYKEIQVLKNFIICLLYKGESIQLCVK